MEKGHGRGGVPLGLLSSGEQGEIIEVRSGRAASGHHCPGECRVEEMGLRVGKRVEMLNNGGGGALLLKVDEARIALDRRTAMKIMIREVGR